MEETLIPVEELAATAQRAFAAAGGADQPWEELAEPVQDAWLYVATLALKLQAEGCEANAQEMAQRFYVCWSAAQGSAAEWPRLPKAEQIAWEGVARHLAWLVTEYDERDDLAGLEASWRAWASARRNLPPTE